MADELAATRPEAFEPDYPEIREQVARLCRDFPGGYWRTLDRERAYPSDFVRAFVELWRIRARYLARPWTPSEKPDKSGA